jgi:hypothetical protein
MGAWLGGVTFDMTDSYAVAWGSMIVIGLAAAAAQWFMDDRPEPRRWHDKVVAVGSAE